MKVHVSAPARLHLGDIDPFGLGRFGYAPILAIDTPRTRVEATPSRSLQVSGLEVDDTRGYAARVVKAFNLPGARVKVLKGVDLPQATATFLTNEGLRAPGPLTLDWEDPSIGVEVPADYQEIKAVDPALALSWREATREVFERYFAEGRAVVGFAHERVRGEARSFYVLETLEGEEEAAR